jgi:hypothetical protein
MKATGKYVYDRIGNPKGKEAYRLSMKSCLEVMNAGWIDIGIIKTKIRVEHSYKTTLFNKYHAEITYHNLAIDNALDIVSKLETRFITGEFDLTPRVYRFSLESLKEGNDGLFD